MRGSGVTSVLLLALVLGSPSAAESQALTIPEAPGSAPRLDRPTDPRVPPLAEAEWGADQRRLVERYAPDGNAGNALRTLMRVPALADRVFPFMGYLTSESTLSPRHRAILHLRTAWVTQSANIWATHASRAAESGLTADEVRRVAEGPGAGWSEFEAVLIGMADEFFRNSSITDRTWAALSEQYDVHNLADAVVTVSETTSQGILFNSLGIQPDDDASARMPTDVPYRVLVPARDTPLTAPRIEPVEGGGLRVSRTFARHPDMNRAWNTNPGYVLNPQRSRLEPHDRELLILRTGWNAQAVYEWAKHVGSVGRARDRGLEPLWIAQGRDATGWADYERTLIDAANEMYRYSMISDETWASLSGRYDTHQMMSVAATAARYRMVSMSLNAFGVQPLPDDELFPTLEGY